MRIQEKVFNPSGSGNFRGARGWTLQELLAPRKVIFFDSSWTRLGSNHDLQDVISWVTTIPPEILSGQQSVHQRSSFEANDMGRRERDDQTSRSGLLSSRSVGCIYYDEDSDVRASFERLKKVFLEFHPEHKKVLDCVEDFYSFLNDRYQAVRWDAVDFERIISERQILFSCYHFSRYALDIDSNKE
ncbi:hypothetical protein K435DRAFT_880265 [Dendrothele bispora CBS 962.96]|uniref:Uncharacterized protein n=1 Tax=Dendrothele bispora (strain CBS 962.96) TaxID=1314807 RepID=A0A4S8KJT4_DENBC|nr:hypothetical protein K435DRAFT_880265 [Dendrothele bispora CBS 962.96]